MGLSSILGGLIQHSLQPSSEEILQDKLKTQAALFGQQKQQRQGILDELNLSPVQRALDIQAQQAQNYATYINEPKSLLTTPYKPTEKEIGKGMSLDKDLVKAGEFITPIFESMAPPGVQERADYYAKKAEEAKLAVPAAGADRAMKLFASQYLGQTGQSHSVANTMINNQGAMNRLKMNNALRPREKFNNVQLNSEGQPIGLNQQGQFQNIPTQQGFVPVPKRSMAPNITVGGKPGFVEPHKAPKGYYWNQVAGNLERIPNALESNVTDMERKSFYQYEQIKVPYETYRESSENNEGIGNDEFAASYLVYKNDPTGYLGVSQIDENLRREFSAREPIKDAMLRADSGAALTEYEINNIDKLFFRVPGDTDKIIADKKTRLAGKIEAMKRKSGRAVDLYESQEPAKEESVSGFSEEEIKAAMGE